MLIYLQKNLKLALYQYNVNLLQEILLENHIIIL